MPWTSPALVHRPWTGLVSQALQLTPTDSDPGGQVCQGSRLDGVNTATKGKAPALLPLFYLILTSFALQHHRQLHDCETPA